MRRDKHLQCCGDQLVHRHLGVFRHGLQVPDDMGLQGDLERGWS